MRDFKKPVFKTAQYWGLVKMLKAFMDYPLIDKADKVAYIDGVCAYLKADNPKFNKEQFIKAINESV